MSSKAVELLCRRLTAAAHARYLKGNTFYTVAQLAGKQACCPEVVHLLSVCTACHAAQSCKAAGRDAKHACLSDSQDTVQLLAACLTCHAVRYSAACPGSVC